MCPQYLCAAYMAPHLCRTRMLVRRYSQGLPMHSSASSHFSRNLFWFVLLHDLHLSRVADVFASITDSQMLGDLDTQLFYHRSSSLAIHSVSWCVVVMRLCQTYNDLLSYSFWISRYRAYRQYTSKNSHSCGHHPARNIVFRYLAVR